LAEAAALLLLRKSRMRSGKRKTTRGLTLIQEREQFIAWNDEAVVAGVRRQLACVTLFHNEISLGLG